MALPQLKEHQRFSYADYLAWPDGERWELINGVPYAMSPAPGSRHQHIQAGFIAQLYTQLKGRVCQVFGAPFDVKLSAIDNQGDNEIDTVVQPDVVVVCDKNKIDDRGCNGAPDLIIEILSPSTSKYDLSDKRSLYEQHGVGELWFVHPLDRTAMIFYLQENNKYGSPDVYGVDASVVLRAVDGIAINLGDIFTE